MLSKTKPKTLQFLNQQRNQIRSRTGGWFPGKGVFSHGYSMLDELVGKKSYFQIMILNATGRLVERPLADWIEAIYGCLSWPDPRIWCNQIGALAGSTKASAIAATSMGILATDSRAYGIFPLIQGMIFIQQAMQQYQQGDNAVEIVQKATKKTNGKPYIVGYLRPIAKGDERLDAMEKISRELGFNQGEHLALAYKIEQVLLKQFDESMNINGYMSAFLSDQGFTPEEVYHIFSPAVMSGVTACYLDTLQRPAHSFLPLRCDDINYQGESSRPVPSA